MSKKFSIVRTIDFEKLNYEINGCVALTGEKNPYIFMNKDTIDAITSACEVTHVHPYDAAYTTNREDCKGYYCGYKVFVDNDLKFGEVEVR